MIGKLLEWGLLTNRWGWFHALSGGVMFLIGTRLLGLVPGLTFAVVGLIAVAWEALEYATQDIEAVYGHAEVFFFDAVGDLVLTLAVAGLVWLG